MLYKNSKNTKNPRLNNKAQVWIETVIYTLIGITIITIIISVATPQIEKIKDKSIVTNMFGVLTDLDAVISEVTQAEGYIKNIPISIGKGSLEINSSGNFIKYTLENTRLEASEPGEDIPPEANIKIKTERMGSKFKITLTREYNDLNITFNNQIISRTLHGGGAVHSLVIQNMGDNAINAPTHIDFTLL